MPSVLTDLTAGEWATLLLTLLLLPGPGMALVAWIGALRWGDLTQQLALASVFSVALLALALAGLQLLGIAVNGVAVAALLATGWALYGWRSYRGARVPADEPPFVATRRSTLLLWAVLAVSMIVQLAVVREVVVQPGSDGSHHTLIAQTIVARGGLPADLLPLTPLVSFTYHYVYHALVAVFGWLTGAPVVALVVIVTQLLKVGAAFTAALLAEVISGKRSAGIVTALLAGMVMVFPSYYVNWGRNTQLTGLFVLGGLMAVVWQWSHRRPQWSLVAAVAILAAGTVLAHYRVTLMAAIGCSLIVLAAIVARKWTRAEVKVRIGQLLAMPALTLLLLSPWLWHVWQSLQQGYPAPVGTPAATFYQIDRLGERVLNYPTNTLVLAAALLALGWGIWRRLPGVLVMALWLAVAYGLSMPWGAGQYMDTITVVTSAFLPVGVGIGVAAADFLTLAGAWHWRRWVVATVLLAATLLGGRALFTVVEPDAAYVTPDDLAAAAWMREHVPEDALFMVNTFRFGFLPKFVVAADAGGWLPVLAQRAVVTAPMTYSVERTAAPGYVERIVALADLGNDLTSDRALAMLRSNGVTHVFIGARGGPIDPTLLLASPHFQLEYQQGSTYVFSVADPSTSQ
jgi:hypothetical protein